MILPVLFAVLMFLWFLSLLPIPRIEPFAPAQGFLAFISVLLLGLHLFLRL